MGPERTEEIISELSSILTRSNLNSIQNEEISNILILLLSSIATIDLALGKFSGIHGPKPTGSWTNADHRGSRILKVK